MSGTQVCTPKGPSTTNVTGSREISDHFSTSGVYFGRSRESVQRGRTRKVLTPLFVRTDVWDEGVTEERTLGTHPRVWDPPGRGFRTLTPSPHRSVPDRKVGLDPSGSYPPRVSILEGGTLRKNVDLAGSSLLLHTRSSIITGYNRFPFWSVVDGEEQ